MNKFLSVLVAGLIAGSLSISAFADNAAKPATVAVKPAAEAAKPETETAKPIVAATKDKAKTATTVKKHSSLKTAVKKLEPTVNKEVKAK